MKYIVSLSGGNNSLNCLSYCIQKFGKENVIAIFADNHFEDETLYQGLDWIEKYFNIKIVKVQSDKYENPFDANFKRHVIWHNAVICTEEMKIKPIKKWIKDNFPNKDEFCVVLGYNKDEYYRIKKAIRFQEKAKDYNLYFPALEGDWYPLNYVDWRDLFCFPCQKVYEKGGRSNNCGGGCFKMSNQGWYLLWKNDPETFRKWVDYEILIHHEIIRYRERNYSREELKKFKTQPKHLWIDRKKSLFEKSLEWAEGKVPKFRKRKEGDILGKCQKNSLECGFSI